MGSAVPVATDILSPHAIVRLEDDAVVMLDQRRLPAEAVELRLVTWQQVAEAIREMAVRGAPAIGVAAAYGVALAAARSTAGSVEVLREDVARAATGLVATRPDGRQPVVGGQSGWSRRRRGRIATRPRCARRSGTGPRRSTPTRSIAACGSASTARASCAREPRC